MNELDSVELLLHTVHIWPYSLLRYYPKAQLDMRTHLIYICSIRHYRNYDYAKLSRLYKH